MKAIVLATTFKGQDRDKIIDRLEDIQHTYPDHILIHGFMPLKEVIEKGFDPEFINSLRYLFPVQLNMYDKKPLREAMADVAKKLEAEVVVIGEIKEGVAEEIELYKEAGLKIIQIEL